MTNAGSVAAAAKLIAVESKQVAFNTRGSTSPVTVESKGRNVSDGSLAVPRVIGDRVTAHKFTIGQIVDLTPNMFRAAAAGQYEVRRLMPASERDGANPSYRIKSVEENHERVASEDELTPSRLAESLL
jgi:hypothetical protein